MSAGRASFVGQRDVASYPHTETLAVVEGELTLSAPGSARHVIGAGSGAVIAAIAGSLYGTAYSIFAYNVGEQIIWWSFIAAVLGGIGSIRGAVPAPPVRNPVHLPPARSTPPCLRVVRVRPAP